MMSLEEHKEFVKENKPLIDSIFVDLDKWVDAKIDRLVAGLKPSLDLHTAALEKNAEASTLLAMRLTDFIEHQFHTTR